MTDNELLDALSETLKNNSTGINPNEMHLHFHFKHIEDLYQLIDMARQGLEATKELGYFVDILEKVYQDARDNPEIMAVGVYGMTPDDIYQVRKKFNLKNENSK